MRWSTESGSHGRSCSQISRSHCLAASRVSRILVKEVHLQGDRPVADLDLIVASKAPTNVTEMIQEMESQGIFTAVLVSQNPQRGRGETGSEYELNVHYVPRAGFAIDPSDTRPPVDTNGEGGKTR